jgi:hypothetical protein
MPFHFPYVVDSGVTLPPRNPISIQETYLGAETNVSFSWTSRTKTDSQEIVNSSSIAGDHIVIHSSWDVPVSSSNITIRSGFNITREGKVAAPIDSDEWPSPLCCLQNYSWETFDGIHAGDNVRVSLNLSQGGDAAFDVYYWTDANQDDSLDMNELEYPVLLASDNEGAGYPESGSFRSRLSKSIVIRIYCWNYAYLENMTYNLNVDTKEELVIENETGSPTEVVYDTYFLLRNATVNLTLSASYNFEILSVEYSGISFGNYFVPNVKFAGPYHNPIQDEIVNISWTCSDFNANDTNYFSVWLSYDDGHTFQRLVQNVTQTYCLWNSTGWLIGDYTYRIRAFSLDFTIKENDTPLCSTDCPPSSYWPGDYSDVVSPSFESSGPIIFPPTTTTTSIETPSTTAPTPDNFLFTLSFGLSVGVISGLVGIVVLRQRGLLKWK